VDGLPAGLHYTSDNQINIRVPPDARVGTVNLALSPPSATATVTKVPMLAAAPGIFFDPFTGDGFAFRRGFSLEIYCTGLGKGLPVKVFLGGGQFVPSLSGPDPLFPGLDKVNVPIPAGMSGPQTLSIEVNGRRSSEVRVIL